MEGVTLNRLGIVIMDELHSVFKVLELLRIDALDGFIGNLLLLYQLEQGHVVKVFYLKPQLFA